MKRPRIDADSLRNIIFGAEDSLVSTTGLVVGVSVGSQDLRVALMAGFVALIVEALSMGVGAYLSEQAVHELEPEKHQDNLVIEGLLMFGSYVIAGFVPLTPLLILDYPSSIWGTIATALAGLFLLGYAKGNYLGIPALRSGVQMFVLGGLAALAGIAVGLIFKV
ncbi:VIT1/CCC1 transporter family protein [Candidatus Berkelbacteria bacterium]|nr:VIT1/CCC1 transporter family protein [Candidatus Berkelbacteria bacterium]